jgi:hypothetical protein
MLQRPSLAIVVVFVFAAVLAAGGAFAQETPDEPEVLQTPETPQAAEAPEADENFEQAEPTEEAELAEEPETSAAPSLAFETSVAFEPAKKETFEARVGEVELRGVEFMVSQPKGGMLGTSDADLKTTISVMIDCATTAEKKAKFELTVFFLDAEGNVIDRTSAGFGLKSGSKIFEIKHTTLKYVVPLIKTAKLSAVAK